MLQKSSNRSSASSRTRPKPPDRSNRRITSGPLAVRSSCSSASSSVKRADATLQAMKTKPLDELDETMSLTSSHWDTDLEDDDDSLEADKSTDKESYEKVCEKLGVIPVSRFGQEIGQEKITINYRFLRGQGAKAIASVLVKTNTTLKLEIAANELSPKGGVYMGRVLQRNGTLRELNLANNNINKQGIIAISKSLSENTVIRRLDLSGNGLTDKDSQVLSDAVENNTSLRYLNLSYNKLGELSGQYFGSALSYNNGLTELNLSWNSIRRKGAQAINKSLRLNDTLEKLDLSWNGFDDFGTDELIEALKRNTSLIDLNFSNNRLTDTAMMNIARGLDGNTTLEVLDLSRNPVRRGCNGVTEILKNIKKKRCSLTTLKLIDVQLDCACHDIISDCLKKNEQLTIEFGCKKKDTFSSKKVEVNPIGFVNDYLSKHKLHSSDLFKRLDIDGQFKDSLTRTEFIEGMRRLNILNEHYLNKLVDMLDTDGNGEIDYSEFVKLS